MQTASRAVDVLDVTRAHRIDVARAGPGSHPRAAHSLKKVCAFLLEMAERSGGRASGEIVLPMSRYDIADYLAISVETVSRALTSLHRRRMIALSGRRKVKIIDRAAVEEGCQKHRAMPPTGC